MPETEKTYTIVLADPSTPVVYIKGDVAELGGSYLTITSGGKVVAMFATSKLLGYHDSAARG